MRGITNCNWRATPLLSRGGESRRGSGGWGGDGQRNSLLLTNTTPAAPSAVASQSSIDGAATPPRLRRGTRGILLTLLFVVFAVDCSAQSLADVARRERERQKRLHSEVIVANGATTTTAAATSSTSSTPSTSAAPAPQAEEAKPTGPTDNKGHDEKYWRTQFKKARDDAKRADEKVQLLDLRVKDLNGQLLNRTDIYNRENQIGPQIAAAQKELEEARTQAELAKKKITDLEDELRRAGGPPGWSR
jgi:hypothetical protein